MENMEIAKLPPRYSFILNSYSETRLSKCPKCGRLTHMRKFPFLIHIEEWGFLILGKTCRYCAPCELIMMHQDELEDELCHSFEDKAPDVIGNKYTVFGTVDKRVWREGLQRHGNELDEVLDAFTMFKEILEFEFEPGGWYPPGLPKNVR